MSKRKLTERQTERVREHHQKRLTRSAARSASRATPDEELTDLGPEFQDAVLNYPGQCTVGSSNDGD